MNKYVLSFFVCTATLSFASAPDRGNQQPTDVSSRETVVQTYQNPNARSSQPAIALVVVANIVPVFDKSGKMVGCVVAYPQRANNASQGPAATGAAQRPMSPQE